MNESLKAVFQLLVIVGSIVSFVGFAVESFLVGFISAVFALASLGALIWGMRRRDKVPDFLKRVGGEMLERDGFCFKMIVSSIEGRCTLDLYFQSRYERASRAAIVLQPSQGFFLNRPGLASMVVKIECPPGGYGITRVPWPVAKAFHGKTQSLDIGADVSYPDGRGAMIRFAGGMQIGSVDRDVWKALTVVALLGGMIVMEKPAKVNLRFPKDVEEEFKVAQPITTEVRWRLGDPMPES